LQKSVPHESLTLPFEPFRFRLRTVFEEIFVIEKRLSANSKPKSEQLEG
jgi:hypothetical protein